MATLSFLPNSVPLTDLVLGAEIYFPPIFKAVMLGTLFWLMIHRLLRSWIYSDEIWHPLLMDLSLFMISVSAALWVLTGLDIK